MKILHVIPHFYPSPNFGGTPEACHQIAKAESELGHSVDVLTTDVYSLHERVSNCFIDAKNIPYNVFRVRNLSNFIAYRFKMSLSLEAYFFLYRNAHTYDVIHLHEYRSLLNVMVAFTPNLRAKIILQPHGTFENYNGRTIFKRIFDALFSKKILSSASKILALSEKEKTVFLKHNISSKKVFIIPNGISPQKRIRYSESLLSHKLPQSFILYLGRINKIKNLENLVLAYNSSILPKKNIYLVIAGGDDGYLKSLLKLIGNNHFIKYIGALNNAEKNVVLNNCLFVSYISFHEPWGLVPLEAAMNRKKCLISNDSGVAKIVSKYNLGIQVNPKSIHDITNALNAMISDSNTITDSVVRKLKNELSWSKIATQLIRLYVS